MSDLQESTSFHKVSHCIQYLIFPVSTSKYTPTFKIPTTEYIPFARPLSMKLNPFQYHSHKGGSPFSRPLAQMQPLCRTILTVPHLTEENDIQHYCKLPNSQQEMLEPLQQCTPQNTKPKSRGTRASQYRNNRPQSIMKSNCRHSSTPMNTETESSRSLSLDTASNSTTTPHQVSHFTALNPLSCLETSLITDTATDGHTSFHTTLQTITSQGSKPSTSKLTQAHQSLLYPYPTSTRSSQVFSQDRSSKEDIPQICNM